MGCCRSIFLHHNPTLISFGEQANQYAVVVFAFKLVFLY